MPPPQVLVAVAGVRLLALGEAVLDLELLLVESIVGGQQLDDEVPAGTHLVLELAEGIPIGRATALALLLLFVLFADQPQDQIEIAAAQ